MATPGDRIREPSGVELVYVDTAGASDGRRLVCEWTIPSGRRLVARAHRHPDGPEDWTVIEGDARWNLGARPLVVRQTIEADVDGLALGVERYFETIMALAQRGETDEDFDIRSRLQSALTIRELLMPGSYLAGPPTWLQDALFASLAALARRRGLEAHIEPQRER